MLLVKTQKAKNGKNYIVLIYRIENKDIFLSFNIDVICHCCCWRYRDYWFNLKNNDFELVLENAKN